MAKGKRKLVFCFIIMIFLIDCYVIRPFRLFRPTGVITDKEEDYCHVARTEGDELALEVKDARCRHPLVRLVTEEYVVRRC